MSAKFVFSLPDEKPDMQKQIGCMNGLFQLFDRHHFPGSQRIARANHKRLPPPGQNDNHGSTEPKIASQRIKEDNFKKTVKEKTRFSFDSPRTSCSSSSYSSSFSSADCSKASQVHRSSVSQTTFPEPRQEISRDVRYVVRNSIYRESCGLSIKTATKVEAGWQQTLKHIDSPRPLQQSPKSAKTRNTCLNELSRVPAKLQEVPRMSNGRKDGSLAFTPRDASRFSYDERGSRDGPKIKLKDLPRLSLDSRESSIKRSINGTGSNFVLGELNRSRMNPTEIRNLQQEEPGSYKGPSSVVAKLMGLEALPSPNLTNGNQSSQIKTCADPLSHSPRIDESKKNWISGSISDSEKEKELSSPCLTIADTKKPIATRCPIEPAPWKQLSGNKGQISFSLKCQETPMTSPNFSVTVYGEIEKRLSDLEFKKSGKDLRALKQILEAIQKSKQKSEIRKEDQPSNFTSPATRIHAQSSEAQRKLQSSNAAAVTVTGTSSPKHIKSQIKVIKPEKFRENASNTTTSTVSPGSLSRLRISNLVDTRKEKVEKRSHNDLTPRPNPPKGLSGRLHSRDKNTSRTLRFNQTSKELSPTARETPKLEKSSETTCLKLQLKKLELEKQSWQTSSSSEQSRRRRQSSRLQAESGLPHRKPRHKPHNLQKSDDQLSDISSDMRDLSHQGDSSSMKSESNMSMASYGDIEVTSADRSCKTKGTFSQKHENKQNNPAARFGKGDSTAEPPRVAPEQPSPVSVLNATFHEDESPSPVKKKSNAFKEYEGLIPDEADWSTVDSNNLSSSRETSLSFKTDYKEEYKIQQLVRKLMNLDSIQEWSIDHDIAHVYNSSNLDHKYIAEVLLASGLLNELESSFIAYQLRPSYHHPIDPNLFPALEQTKASIRHLNGKYHGRKINQLETIEKNHRQLIFDAVNEVLIRKLEKESSYKQWFSPSIVEYRKPRRQQLVRDLCSDIDKLQNASNENLDDEEEKDDGLKSILWGDLTLGSKDWTECWGEIPWVVLDVERLIFKDLICEVISGEAANLQGHTGGHCRKLF